MAVWIIRDAWELGYEYECSYCHKLIDVRHKGVDLPVKCPYCGEKVGDKDAEYIKREALLKEAAKNRAIGLCEADIVDIRGLINAQPTADVVEVKHGRWEPVLDGVWNLPTPVLSGWRCSECGRTEQEKEPYCNCGARTDGESDG